MTPVTLFSYITPEEQERMRVCFDMREVVYRNNEVIMEYSSSMKKIGLILEGQAALYCCDEDGNQYMLDELKQDSVFGEPFLLPEEAQHYYVCAKSKTRVLFIAYEHVIKRCENACAHHSRMVENMFRLVADKATALSERVEVLSRRSIRDKLLCYFSLLAARSGGSDFSLPFSLSALADYISADRSAMMRELKKMREEDLLSVHGRDVTLYAGI